MLNFHVYTLSYLLNNDDKGMNELYNLINVAKRDIRNNV